MKFTRKTDLPRGSGTARPGDESRAKLEKPDKFTRKTDLPSESGTARPADGPRVELEKPDVSGTPQSVAPRAARARERRKTSRRGYLDGQMLVAMPAMGDDRFARSVIYVCAHSSEGAMGIIVNQPAANISFADLLVQLEVVPAADLIRLPPRAGGVKVLKGGPVDTQRGFVLHSSDFFIKNSTLPIDEGVCLTATLDILKAIARGEGPRSAILALGYAGWAPGQLENEIQHNGWLHCAADPELIFGQDVGGKYAKALKKIGIDLGMLSSEAGHA